MGLANALEGMFKNSLDAANPFSGKGALLKPLTAPLVAPAQAYGAFLQDTGGNPNHSFGALDPNGNLNEASRQGAMGSMSVVRGGIPQDQYAQLQNPQQPGPQTTQTAPAPAPIPSMPALNQPLAQNQQQQKNALGAALLQLLQTQ